MAQNPLELFQNMRDKPPDEAKFFWSGGPVEVADDTWFQSLFSGCTAFATAEGLVLVDSGLAQMAPALAESLREKTSAPVHTAIFTQGHVDHAFGLKHFLAQGQPPPRVIGHRDMPARFARYRKTRSHNQAINARQFGATVEASEIDRESYATFGTPDIPPDTLYDERLDISVGGLTFEIHHCRGETDDHSWIFCPERSVLCPGDLFIYCVPNAGNPQKVQRYPWEWADGLRVMAAREPRSLCPGHGGPVVNDPEKIQRMLLETADFLDAIVSDTLAAMEEGSPPHNDILHKVRIPKSESPWLQPVYDEAEFIIHNIIRYYGGWWNGRPSDLKPAPRRDLAREMTALCGGVETIMERAQALADAGEFRLACHLADYALEACPDDEATCRGVASIYQGRAEAEGSLMAVNLYHSAAAYAQKGRAFA